MNRWCIVREGELTEATRSREHLILAALGGRKTTSRALCRSCNNATGTRWDSMLEKQLRPISIFLDSPSKRLSGKSRIVKGEDGQEMILKRGLRGGPAGPVLLSKRDGDSDEIYLSAESKSRLRQEIARLVKQGIIPETDVDEIMSTTERVEVETEVEFEEFGGIGGPAAFNSMLKSMMSAGCEAGLTLYDMLTAREALCGRLPDLMWLPVGVSGTKHGYEGDKWMHCVHVETEATDNQVWGYLELYGTFRYLAVLGQRYLGEHKTFTYCLDSQTGHEVDVQVDLDEPKKIFQQAKATPAEYANIAREHQGDPTALVEWAMKKHEVQGRVVIEKTKYGMEQPSEKARIFKLISKLP